MALIILTFWIFRVFWVSIIGPCVKCCCNENKDLNAFFESAGDADDEGLPPYWSAIPGHLQKAWYTQEVYDQKALGIINLTGQ